MVLNHANLQRKLQIIRNQNDRANRHENNEARKKARMKAEKKNAAEIVNRLKTTRLVAKRLLEGRGLESLLSRRESEAIQNLADMSAAAVRLLVTMESILLHHQAKPHTKDQAKEEKAIGRFGKAPRLRLWTPESGKAFNRFNPDRRPPTNAA